MMTMIIENSGATDGAPVFAGAPEDVVKHPEGKQSFAIKEMIDVRGDRCRLRSNANDEPVVRSALRIRVADGPAESAFGSAAQIGQSGSSGCNPGNEEFAPEATRQSFNNGGILCVRLPRAFKREMNRADLKGEKRAGNRQPTCLAARGDYQDPATSVERGARQRENTYV